MLVFPHLVWWRVEWRVSFASPRCVWFGAVVGFWLVLVMRVSLHSDDSFRTLFGRPPARPTRRFDNLLRLSGQPVAHGPRGTENFSADEEPAAISLSSLLLFIFFLVLLSRW